ncbi:MAG: hypothetical protein GXO35_07675 [Gammaproteobacteria bacterium]|nr:hypothetical protein [Gammaproteobacteria bacterium]
MTNIKLQDRPIDVIDNIRSYRSVINDLMTFYNTEEACETGINIKAIGQLFSELDSIELQAIQQNN